LGLEGRKKGGRKERMTTKRERQVQSILLDKWTEKAGRKQPGRGADKMGRIGERALTRRKITSPTEGGDAVGKGKARGFFPWGGM